MWYNQCSNNDTVQVAGDQLNRSTCTNLSEQVPILQDVPGLKYFTLVAYLCTFIFGLCGNTLVIYIIGYFSKVRLKSVANYYIWNLAFADLLFILALPLYIWASYIHNWPLDGTLGNASCKLAYVARDISKFASIFTLTALSVDRALASCHYLGYLRTVQVGKVVCLIIWIVCFIIATPYFMYAQTVQNAQTGVSCRLAWPSPPSYYTYMQFWVTFQVTLGLIIPSLIIICSYIILFRRLRHIDKRSDNLVKRPSRRMTQTVVAVVVTFIVCQVPYHVTQLLALPRMRRAELFTQQGLRYKPDNDDMVRHVWLNALSQMLIFVSSCTNPIIYGLLNENFRRLYKLVLCRCHGNNCHHLEAENLEIDEPYTALKFRFEMSFHLPCVGFHRMKQYRKQHSNGDVAEKIEMGLDIEHETTMNPATLETCATP